MMRSVTGNPWRTRSGSATMCMPMARGPWCALTASRLAGTAPSLAGTACHAQRACPSAQSGGSASRALRSCTARAPLPVRKQSVAAQGSSSGEELGRGMPVGTAGTACGDAQGAAVEALNPRRKRDEARFQEVLAAVEGHMRERGIWPRLGTRLANMDAGGWVKETRFKVRNGTALPYETAALYRLAAILHADMPVPSVIMNKARDITAALPTGATPRDAAAALLPSPSTMTDVHFADTVKLIAVHRCLFSAFPGHDGCLHGVPLGQWLSVLRMDYRSDELPPARLELTNGAVRRVLGHVAPADGEDTATIRAWAGSGAFTKARWSRRLHETTAFVSVSGRHPRKNLARIADMSAADAHEHRLAIWLSTNYKNMTRMPQERAQRLDAALGLWWREPRAVRECCVAALRHVDQCVAIGLIPDSVALGLRATWISALAPYSEDQGAACRAGHSEFVVAGRVLPARVGSSAQLRARQWLSRAYAARAYQVEHGRLPKGGKGPVQALLVDQPSAPHTHAALLEAHDSVLAAASQRVASAVPYHARLPGPADSSFDLSGWLTNVRSAANRGILDEGMGSVLDALLGDDWRVAEGVVERQCAWELGLAHVLAFQQQQGRLPMQTEVLVSRDGTEVRVGQWRNNQRHWASVAHRLELDRQVPGWDGPC